MSKALPEGKLARAAVVGSTAVKIGLGHARHRAKRPFLSADQRHEDKNRLDDQHARLLFNALTQLRGTALKAAQMLSFEVEILPPQYQRELQKSYHQVPPMNRVLVRKALEQALGTAPEVVFQRFDWQAFAAASLGQVHAATLHDGTEVAIKIQYPGIHVAMDSDLALLRTLLRKLPNAPLALQSLDEVQARLVEELDYRLEAENTRLFSERVQLDTISFPRVIEDFSCQRVLTTTRCDGQHLDSWLAQKPSQDVRNRAAQSLYDLFIHSMHTLGTVHADPNPGNYLFADDGSVTVLDFGCVKQLSANFIQTAPALLQAYRDNNPGAVYSAYAELGMSANDDGEQLYNDVLKDFGQWVTEPMRDDSFDFGRHGNYTRRARDMTENLMKLGQFDAIADDFIFFDRTQYGLYKIFERLGAEVRIRHHWF